MDVISLIVPAQAIRSGQFTFVEADWKNVTKEGKE
jgi:hypothetical protein